MFGKSPLLYFGSMSDKAMEVSTVNTKTLAVIIVTPLEEGTVSTGFCVAAGKLFPDCPLSLVFSAQENTTKEKFCVLLC